eukprot:GEMP01003983.1.p1 GENE.GEMP01003983.1~~GEMP01003983.1.p1  ORF type:complete len:1382 (+),score=370.47 GEMP01003983.1:167-4312(+)
MDSSLSQVPTFTLSHKHVFGLKTNVNHNVHFAEETQIIYPAGNNTILYYTDHKTQRFFPGSDNGQGITALAISPNKRFLAAAEMSTPSAIINIFDLVTSKKKKTLTFSADADGIAVCHEIVSMAFSSENKFLITQSGMAHKGDSHWTLVYWAWDKARPMASMKVSNAQNAPIYEVSFNPTDSSVICVTGEHIFKFLRLQEGTFKTIPSQLSKYREQQSFLCHSWLQDEGLVVGCQNGELLVFDITGEYRHTLAPKEGQARLKVTCVASFSKGFVTGGEDCTIRVYEKSEDTNESYRQAKQLKLDSTFNASIESVAISPSEECLVVTTSSGQLYQHSLLSSDLLKSEEAPQFETVLTSFHIGPILGMDVCVRKPLVVTCGADKTVRIWNYIDKTCHLMKQFNEEPTACAFHPSGFLLIVGFSDKLRLMNLLMEDMRTFKDLPIKACRECRFSNGGQYFACVNSNQIQVYKTYTCELVANLRGHNNKVRSLSWTMDDATLVSAGIDGAVYEFNIIQEGRRVSDYVLKGTSFSSVIVYTDPSTGQNMMYCVGNDKQLKEVYQCQLRTFFEANIVLGQLALSNSAKTLFCSTADNDMPGAVRCYRFPLDGEFIEYQCHALPATRIRVTTDDTYLFSCSEDGSLYIFDIRKKDRAQGRRGEKESALGYADEILVTRTFLDEKQAQLVELERQVDELSNQIDFQLRHRDSYHKEKMAELEDKYGQEIESERTKYELLREEKNDMEMEYEENMKKLEELHAKQTQDLEASFQHKMMIEVGRYQKSSAEREREHAEWERQHSKLLEEHQCQVNELSQHFEDQHLEDASQRHRIVEEKMLAQRAHEETLRQLEQDADREIEELKEQYEEKLAQEKEDKVRLRGQAGIHRKHHEDLKRQMNKKEEELRQQQDAARKKQERIDLFMKERDINSKDIKERDNTIGDKEQRIYDLKKQNQELEKFKFVLDYKIKELKSQIDPKNQDISSMKEQIQEMDRDLEDYHRKNKQLQVDIEQLEGRQKSSQDDIVSQRKKLSDSYTLIKRMNNDFHECVQYIQEPGLLKEKISALYKKYVPNGVRQAELDVDIEKEYNRQKEYLEKSVQSLKHKLIRDSNVHRQDNVRVLQENVSLIKEINELRREITYLKHERQQQKLDVKKEGDDDHKKHEVHSQMSQQAQAESEQNRREIARLRKQVQEKENSMNDANLGKQGPSEVFQDEQSVAGEEGESPLAGVSPEPLESELGPAEDLIIEAADAKAETVFVPEEIIIDERSSAAELEPPEEPVIPEVTIVDETAPLAEDTAPPVESVEVPPAEDTAPPAESGEVPPAEETVPPAEETAPPAEESASPAEETAPPAEEPAPLAEETPPPPVEETSAEEAVPHPVDAVPQEPGE